MLGAPAGPEEAQHSVEFLCTRFSALFAHLHREEAELRAAEERNQRLERRLVELRQREAQETSHARAEVDGKHAETLELHREVEAAERRLALGGGEADALAGAAAAYKRQAERLRERCEDEATRQQEAASASKRRAEELGELRQQRLDLCAELEGAEAGKVKVEEELRLVTQNTTQNCRDIATLEQRVQEERRRGEVSECDVQCKREELFDLDGKLQRTQLDLDNLSRHLQDERMEDRLREEQVVAQLDRRSRCEDELRSLTLQLGERRKEGHGSKLRLAEQTKQIQDLRERLKVERYLQLQEQQTSEATYARLTHVRAELPVAEKALQAAEFELGELHKRSAELEERCKAQRSWRDEVRHKASSSENALARLRDELRILSIDRIKVQQELDQVTADKTRLEVEVEVATPALQDVRRRCQTLENHLGDRVRELGAEVDKTHRYRAEVISARGRAQHLERHNNSVRARLQEQRQLERQRAIRPEPLPSYTKEISLHSSAAELGGHSVPSSLVGARQPAVLRSPRRQQIGADSPGRWSASKAPAEPQAQVSSGRPRVPPSPSAPSPARPGLSNYPMPPQFPSSQSLGPPTGGSSNQVRADQPQLPSGVFDRIDSNKDGVIDRRELEIALRAGEIAPAYDSSSGNAALPSGTRPSSASLTGICSEQPVPFHGTAMEAATLPAADAVRFLCNFVAKEEERLGLGSLNSPSRRQTGGTPLPITMGTPRRPEYVASLPVTPAMGRLPTECAMRG